jgi:hypothetical protein
MQKSRIVQALLDSGIMPPRCLSFELIIHVEKPILIRLECYASKEQAEVIAQAIEDNPDEAREWTKLATPKDHLFRAGQNVPEGTTVAR